MCLVVVDNVGLFCPELVFGLRFGLVVCVRLLGLVFLFFFLLKEYCLCAKCVLASCVVNVGCMCCLLLRFVLMKLLV